MPPDSPFDPLGTILAGREAVRAAAIRGAMVEPAPAGELPGFLWFTVGREGYAVEIGRVREVIRPRPVTPVPRAPAGVRGIISHRGAIVAILDLSERLGIEGGSASSAGRIIVVRRGGGSCGLLVDGVGGVITLPASTVAPVPRGGTAHPEFVSGVVRHRGELLMLLDLDGMLDIAEGERSMRSLP